MALLKVARKRIPREASSLGAYQRLPLRIGRAITQEEIAEVVGVFRQWYALLECGQEIRPSPAMLGRVADALMLDARERSLLIEFAIPELGTAQLKPQSSAVLDAFKSMRTSARRLWSATTEDDALNLAREHCFMEFSPDVVVSNARVALLSAIADLTALALTPIR